VIKYYGVASKESVESSIVAYKKRGSETTGRGENHYHDTNYKKIGFLLLSQASISSTLENPQIFISFME
jgi:hypothetical protein